MSKFPKISIIIPTLNSEEYLAKTLNSVFSQNYPDLEVIIMDGESTDGTARIVKNYRNKGIKWFSKKDKGQVYAINKGFKKASGEVVTYINSDDVYKPGALRQVGNYFAENPQALWVAGRGDIIDHKNENVSLWVTAYKNLLLRLNKYTLLLMVNYLVQPAVFISRSAFKKSGPFQGTKGGVVMEYDLWLKLGRLKMPKILNIYLASFRLTKDNISSTRYKEVLDSDMDTVKRYTNNIAILFFHYLHNLFRVLVLKVFV